MTKKEKKPNMDNLERELICPLCKDYFTTPLLLPCQHNVCHRCAKDQVMGLIASNGLNGHSHSHPNSPRTSTPSSPRLSPAGSIVSLPGDVAGPKSPPESPRPSSALSGSIRTPVADGTAARLRKKRSLARRATLSGPPNLPKGKLGIQTTKDPILSPRYTPGPPRRDRGDSFSGKTKKETIVRRDSITERKERRGDSLSSPRERRDSLSGSPRERRDSLSSPRERGDSFSGSMVSSPRRPTLTREFSSHVTNFHCPNCNANVYLGEKGLNGLYRNFALQVIVDRFKYAAKKAASIPCNRCKTKPPADATKSCLDCKKSYCTECFADFHTWGTPRAQHEFIGPTHHFRPKTITCTEHPEEKITLYCDGCQKPVCVKCKFSGVHANHKVAVIERKYAIVKDKLEKHLEAIRDRRESIQESLERLESLSASAESNSAQVRQELSNTLQRLNALLSEKQESLPRQTEEEIARRLSTLGEQIEMYRGVLNQCSVADLAAEMLKETDHACFVQAARPLLTRLAQTVKTLKDCESNDNTSDNFGAFTVNSDRAIEALEKMSFRKVPSTPTIQTKQCQSYGQVVIRWSPPADDIPVETYTLHYRKLADADSPARGTSPIPSSPASHRRRMLNPPTTIDIATDSAWEKLTGITGHEYRLDDLAPNSKFKFKLRAENKAGSSEFSKAVVLRTILSPVTPFKWTLCQSVNLPNTAEISKDGQRVVTSPSFSLANLSGGMASGPIALTPTYVLGDKKFSTGQHYWEISVDQAPSAMQFGIISERKAKTLERSGNQQPNGAGGDRDSGHDSDEVDDEGGLSDPTVLLTFAMGRVLLPITPPPPPTKSQPYQGMKKLQGKVSPSPQPVPTSNLLGVLVDLDLGRVSFYDGENKECMYSVAMKMTVPVQPAMVIIGPGHIKNRKMEAI